jgi:hypothetical protein
MLDTSGGARIDPTAVRAGCDEINGMFNPNPLKPTQVAMHDPL